MNFYREATSEDFESFLNSEYCKDLNPYIKKTLDSNENGSIPKELLIEYKRQTGRGIADAKRHLMPYVRFLQAKKDFESGKKVYVDY